MTNSIEQLMKPREHAKNRNHLGHVQPNRQGKKQVHAFLPEELALAFKQAAKQNGRTVQSLIEELALKTVKDLALTREQRERLMERTLEINLSQYRRSREVPPSLGR